MAKSLLHRLQRRACEGVRAFIVVDVACKKQVSLNTRACKYVCSQVVCYTGVLNASVQFANRCRRHQYTHLRTQSLQGVHMRSCMHSLFSLSLENEGRGLSWSMQGTCLLASKVIFDMRKIGVLSVFSLFFFDGGWSVC